jgi:hypothetical protein
MWNTGRKKIANCCFLYGWKVKLCYTVQWIVGHASTVHWTMEQWTVEACSTVSAGPGPVEHAKCIEPGPT